MKNKSGFAHLLLIIAAVLVVIAAVAYYKGTFAGPEPQLGSLDSVDQRICTVKGWAYDPDSPAKSIKLHIYRDGLANGGGTKVAEVTTNIKREDINTRYKITGDHGFEVTFDHSSELRGGSHKIYIYAIGVVPGEPNSLLSGTPREILCSTLDGCHLTSDKFNFNVKLTTADGKSTLNLDGVKVKIELTDNAKANLLANNMCIPGDLPKTSATKAGVVEFSGIPIRNYKVTLLVESLPAGYILAAGQGVVQTLTPVPPLPTSASQTQQLNFKIGKSQ